MGFQARLVTVTMLTALVAGCEIKTTDKDGKTEAATIEINSKDSGKVAAVASGDGLSIDTPGFEGKLNLPGLQLGGENMDLDGMKLYPGSKVTGIKVDADGKNAGQVRIAFTSDGSPAALLDYYQDAARKAGFTIDAPKTAGSTSTLGGSKDGDKRFALVVAPGGTGSSGAIVMSGHDG